MIRIKSSNIAPKTVFYQTNGTGRDTYISSDNGGIVHEKRPFARSSSTYVSLKDFPRQRPVSAAKVVNYHSDGTGRDNYVGCNSGGLVGMKQSQSHYHGFLSNLRQYDHPEEVPITQPRLRSSHSSRGARLMTSPKVGELQINSREFLQKQQDHANYLSKPKMKLVPFYQWCRNSDRYDLLKRKHKMRNLLV